MCKHTIKSSHAKHFSCGAKYNVQAFLYFSLRYTLSVEPRDFTPFMNFCIPDVVSPTIVDTSEAWDNEDSENEDDVNRIIDASMPSYRQSIFHIVSSIFLMSIT